MNYLKNMLPVCGVLVLLLIASSGNVFALSSGPPDEKTGAPNENTCAQAGCHAGNDLNVSGGSLMLTIPETYIPNQVYTIVVNLSRTGQSRWGFEMTALDADGARAGSFAIDDAGNTQLSETNSKQYIKHTSIGTARGTTDEHSWEFQWTAPDADIGPITFYTAGNASNGNFNPIDDYIYTAQEESTPPIPVVAGVSLEVVGADALSTTDAVAGVSYTLKVTNTGNMMDTISLAASAEVGIEGSVLGSISDSERSIELEADASAEVTLIVAGDLFTTPGDYAITVTATSGTDSTMTAEVTTTTTIEVPVIAGVSLEVVGDNALSTTDAVEGVSYTLKVTNTGNMMDTISLAASAEVGIEGSVLGGISDSERSIELEAGASAEVTLTVKGDLFTTPGDYAITVTATSGTDSTMTAEVTTTTTIEMPPTPWDVNDDGTVNIQDLVLVAGQLGESGEDLKGDINDDGTVNIQDLVIVASHLGEDTSGN
ncbi:hypothetical protein C6503_23245 [Candidatus Poribacteria bacterium]|nr:MAG: hypothetical protein C6503_23245 [Candidatus Poribacteria bacterium]